MQYSQLFGRTTKTFPADAKITSHKLLYKGGFIRRISTGRWAFLPLGMRVWEKIYRVIDEEMRAIDCQKLVVPTLHPIEIWKATNRDQAFGEEMLVVEDHHGATFAIGATAEGMMVELVKMFSPSYKDLPLKIYQFSQKFRDDKRPRGGIMRVREFMMKDAYSFCESEKQAMEVYQQFYRAYLKIAKRLDLPVVPALADSGAIGGSLSHEFQVESKDGDQVYFVCNRCGYAANIERAEFLRQPVNQKEKERPFKIVNQPEWVYTMEDNIKHYGEPLWRYLKNVVYKDGKGNIYIASVRGDQDVNEIKLKKALELEALTPAEDKDLEKIGTKHGYVHSWEIKHSYGIKRVKFIGDLGLPMVKNYIGGQKETKTDSVNVNYGRDFKYDILADIVEAKEGDVCGECKKGKLVKKTGFEWGHCFKQDHFYTQPQQGCFTDKQGKQKPLWMGAYGIGIERTMACIVETHHDKNGIIWPKSVSPFAAHLLVIGETREVIRKAEEAYAQLIKAGIEVLFDDRHRCLPAGKQVSAGEKFADADLIGIPIRLIISAKTSTKVEWKERDKQKSEVITVAEAGVRLSKAS